MDKHRTSMTWSKLFWKSVYHQWYYSLSLDPTKTLWLCNRFRQPARLLEMFKCKCSDNSLKSLCTSCVHSHVGDRWVWLSMNKLRHWNRHKEVWNSHKFKPHLFCVGNSNRFVFINQSPNCTFNIITKTFCFSANNPKILFPSLFTAGLVSGATQAKPCFLFFTSCPAVVVQSALCGMCSAGAGVQTSTTAWVAAPEEPAWLCSRQAPRHS